MFLGNNNDDEDIHFVGRYSDYKAQSYQDRQSLL